MRRNLIVLASVISIILASCAFTHKRTYKLAIDPSFYPANVGENTDQVYGFSIDLIQAMKRTKTMNFQTLESGSADLFSGLRQGDYEAVLSPLMPVGVDQKTLIDSNPYLLTGPVLVVTAESKVSSIKEIGNATVGVLINSDAILEVQKFPNILMKTYPSPALALRSLSRGEVSGVVIDALIAYAFCHNMFKSEIQIVGEPLTNKGLRLVTLKGKSEGMVKKFNSALKELKDKGIYQNLRKKWRLTTCP